VKLNKQQLKKIKLHIIIISVAAAAVVIQFILLGISGLISGKLPSQSADERWSGDGTRYSQISCFISPDYGYSINNIRTMHTAMEKKLTDNSITAANENARLWVYSYSAESNVNVKSGRASLGASVTITGGDFFILHPLRLISGSYYSDDLFTQENIVIDEDSAWKLFGSTDVAGLEVTINGTAFVVVGVVETETDDEYPSPHVYMPASVFEKARNMPDITCVEFILPDPVSGFALSAVEEVMTVSESEIDIVDNTARYKMPALYRYIGDFETVVVGGKLIKYPFWENIEKLAEFRCAILLVFRTVCFVLIGGAVLAEFVIFYLAKDRIFAALKNKAINTADNLEKKHRINKMKNKERRRRAVRVPTVSRKSKKAIQQTEEHSDNNSAEKTEDYISK